MPAEFRNYQDTSSPVVGAKMRDGTSEKSKMEYGLSDCFISHSSYDIESYLQCVLIESLKVNMNCVGKQS